MASISPTRVLIVDDNHDAADLAAQLLELSGHVTAAAYGGQQALQAAVDFLPDVVLLDLGMPEMDGYEVAGALRKMTLARQPVLIAYTAWNDAETRQRVLAAGFDQHIVKPANLEVVIRTATSDTFLGQTQRV